MLLDKPRTEAYKNAILSNKELFKDKIVLDIGAGTGILSIFAAQSGAKMVLAVEASNLARMAKTIAEENGFQDVIKVFQSKIEEFELPERVGKVDIIISEWMGFFLLHEGMLDSVIYGRNKFLKPDGLMFPESATIYVAPCSCPSRIDQWDNLYGVNMKSFGQQLRLRKSDKPDILEVKGERLLHEGHIMAWIDLKEVQCEDVDEFLMKEVIVIQNKGKYQGVCIWFDCSFPTADSHIVNQVVLSTSPNSPQTHWKQTVILLPDEACEEVEPLDPIAFGLSIKRNEENNRRYNIQLTMLDPHEEEHSLPCDCVLTKCILMKAHLSKMEIDE